MTDISPRRNLWYLWQIWGLLKCGLGHSLSISASVHCTAVESHVFSFRYGNLKGFPRVHSISEWMIWACSGYQTGGDQIEALHWLPQRRCHTVDLVKVEIHNLGGLPCLKFRGQEIKDGQISNYQFDNFFHSLCLVGHSGDLCLRLPLKPKQPDPPSQRQGRAMRRRRERGQRKPSLLWHLKVCWASSKWWILQKCSGKYFLTMNENGNEYVCLGHSETKQAFKTSCPCLF